MKFDFSNGKTNVFLVFLGLAIITSFTSKILSTYEKNIDFTVLPSNLPNDIVLTDQSSEKISLKLKGYGFNFAKYYFKNPELKFSVNEMKTNKSSFIWTKEKNLFSLERFLSPMTLLNISEDSLFFYFDKYTTKLIPVYALTEIKYDAGYGNFGPLKLTPDSVKVIGPSNTIQTIKSIETELISIENVKNDVKGKIKLKLGGLENTIIENTEVEYFLEVDQYTEETIDVSINVVSNFDKSSFNFFPKTVKVKFLISVDNYVKINPIDFKIECYIDDLFKNNYILEVVKKPDFIKNISLNTDKIQLIILE
jgi:YbbR domain-containing protein